MNLVVRRAKEDDILAIFNLEKLCFNVPWSLDSIRDEVLNNDKALFIVSEIVDEGVKTIVGYMGVITILDEADIMNICVDPMYREAHIATDMMETMIEVTSKMGIKRWTLEVRKSNNIAIKLYKKFGFYEAGIRKEYYLDNKEDAIIMWKGIDTKLN